jgi:hypothetical protein
MTCPRCQAENREGARFIDALPPESAEETEAESRALA